MRSLLPFLCLLLAETKGTGASNHSMPFMVYLDHDNLVCLNWGFDNLQGNIAFKLAVNTTGWVGFGLSPNGGMKGADIVIGGVGRSGNYFTDGYATGNSMPLVDKQQSYTLLSLTESDGQTIMTFQRAIQACDDQDFHITANPIKLIYAYGKTDEVSYHRSYRGTKEVNLLNYMPRASVTNHHYLSAVVDKILIPAIHTYYHCKVMNFPRLKTKHHIYQIEPVIEHHDIVHHMVLYSCPPTIKEAYDKPCYMGDRGDVCLSAVATWAVGGGIYEFPENAGIPIGGEDSVTFYRLEIHYNNPQLIKGRTDSSGLKLHYTSKLREHDVGVLTTGVMPFNDIPYKLPPKASQFHTYGLCNTSYFPRHMNAVPDLHLFAVLLHTHLAGRKIRVGHYRNGEQIDFLALDENYNFEMQQITNSGSIKTIKLGDEIAVECTYSTINRTGFTEMGLATTDEMCLAFLYYFPKISITSCVSQPNTLLLSNTSYKLSLVPIPDDISEYQNLLNTLPQIEVISDQYDNDTFNTNGFIREMMKSPMFTCQNNKATSKLHTPWIMNPAGVMLLLLWVAII